MAVDSSAAVANQPSIQLDAIRPKLQLDDIDVLVAFPTTYPPAQYCKWLPHFGSRRENEACGEVHQTLHTSE